MPPPKKWRKKLVERIQLSEEISFSRITDGSVYRYRLIHGDRVQEDPYPEVGWGVSLFEELSKIKEVCKMQNYIGKQCWQAYGYKAISFGVVTDQKMEQGWLMLQVSWENRKVHTWEKAANLGFEDPKRIQ